MSGVHSRWIWYVPHKPKPLCENCGKLTKGTKSLNHQLFSQLNNTKKMSWQGKIDKAAIYSKAGDAAWAQSGLQLGGAEIAELARGFDNPSGLQSNGLHVAGQKYFLLKADNRSIYGKHENEGIIAVRTNQTILVAHYPAGVQAGEAATIVEKLADYLISVSY